MEYIQLKTKERFKQVMKENKKLTPLQFSFNIREQL